MLGLLEKLIILEDIEAFACLGGSGCLELARQAKVQCFHQGATLGILHRQRKRSIRIILSGEAELAHPNGSLRLGPGQLFKNVALRNEPERKLEALSELVCLELGLRAIAGTVFRVHHKAASTVLERLSQQLQLLMEPAPVSSQISFSRPAPVPQPTSSVACLN